METSAFDYDLPAERIAQQPIEPRDAARLLVDRGAGAPPEHRRVSELADLLAPGDLLVVNRTRVLPARLRLRKESGGAVEVLLLEPCADGDGWDALVRPSRKVPPGTVLRPAAAGTVLRPEAGGDEGLGLAVHDDRGEGRRRVRFVGIAANGSGAHAAELAAIEALGEMPLPPYITTPLADPERYQTVYAERPASAAAPTAGLHLTPQVLDAVAARGVEVAQVELVVGLDTFRPIATDRVEDHRMHTEAYAVPEATWDAVQATRRRGGQVVAVGTTAVRALESAATRGELTGRTDLFIHGDRPFAAVDRLMTNFHQPRSSLLVLIDAFVGPRWRDLYAAALAGDYRFLSFGDAMLLTRGARGAVR